MNSRAVGFSLLLVLGWSTGSWAQVGLVAHYEFDVDFSDSSGNELHGTPIGDAVVVFDDKRGSEVLRLDGSSAAVDLGGSPLFDWSGAFSAAFWINVNAWQGHWDTVLKKESVFSFERNGSNDELSFYHWPNFVPSGHTLPEENVWHHIAATFDGLEQNVYINGELVSSTEIVGEMDVNENPVYIGSNGTTRFFNGSIDDVRLYDRVLSETEVGHLASDEDLGDEGPGPGPRPFGLSLAAPSRLTGVRDSTVRYSVRGTLTTEGLESEEGAGSWSVSIGSESCTIVDISTAGTIVEALGCPNGFVQCEVTSGEGNEGAVCAVVLSTTELCTLPTSGTADIFHLTVERDVSAADAGPDTQPCEADPARVFFVDGRRGAGQPVVNTVVHEEQSFAPTLTDAETLICPVDFHLSLDAPESLTGAPGEVVRYGVTGKLTSDAGEDGEGVSAWSVSLASTECRILEITTAGTIVEALGCPNGFVQCEVTSGEGNEGAVCAVVLSTTELCTLPPTGTAEIFEMMVEADVPPLVESPEDDGDCEPRLGQLAFVDGRRGAGEPVVNTVTFQVRSVTPTSSSAVTSICPVVVELVRGDTNVDGTIDIADAMAVLRSLFAQGRALVCDKSGDADDSGILDITDGIYLLQWLFVQGSEPLSPFPACGPDTTTDTLTCDSFPLCD